MEILLLVVGKTSQTYIKQGIEEFSKRLKHYIPYRIECIPDIKSSRSLSEENQKQREGEALLSNITSADLCVLLDERGKEFSSVEFSAYMQKIMASGKKRAVFMVGGPYGFSKEVYARADAKISLSKMTFTHEMIRLFFTEQLYRALTILRGEPYHHE